MKKSLKYAAATALFALVGQVGLAAGFAPVADAASAVSTITGVGGTPADIVVDSSQHRGYVALQNGGVQVIDTQTKAKVGAVLNTGGRAYNLTLDAASHSVWVTAFASSRVYRIDTTTNTVDSSYVSVTGNPTAITIDGAAHTGYVVSGGAVRTFDTVTKALGTTTYPIPSGVAPQKLDIDPAQQVAYLTSSSTQGNYYRLNLRTGSITAVNLGNYSYGLAIDRVRHLAYLTAQQGNGLLIIDTTTSTTIGFIPNVGSRAAGVTIDQSARQLFVADFDGSRVTVVDLAKRTLLESISLGANKGPTGVAVDTTSHTVFVSDASTNEVSYFTATPVAPLPQSVSFTTSPPSAANVGDTADIAATGTVSGNPVTFSVDSASTSGACTVADHGDATATVSYTGGGTCTVDADQAAGNGYDAAPTAQRTTTVSKQSQVITFTSTAPDPASVGDTYTVTADGGASGQPVTFSSGAPGVCSVQGSTVTFEHSGTCVIEADQAGNDSYDAAPTAQQSVGVGPRAQAINFTSTPPGDATVGGTYTVTATGGDSGNPVVFSTDGEICRVANQTTTAGVTSATVTFLHPGDCFITADQAGDDDHAKARQVQQTVPVAKATQTVTLTSSAPTSAKVGGTSTVTATGGASGNPVTFATTDSSVCTVSDTSVDTDGVSSATVSFVGAGDCTVQADQAGNEDYLAAPTKSQTFAITRVAQTVRITSAVPSPAYVGDTSTLRATGGDSGNPVTFSVAASSDSGACTVSGSTVTFTGAGSCVVAADQAGNAQYAAGHDEQTITVTTRVVTPPASAYEVSGSIATSSRPDAIVIDSSARRAYVTKPEAGQLQVIDTSTDQTVATYPVGSNPYNVALDPAGDRLYVSNNGSSTVSVLVASTGRLVSTISGLASPDGIAVDPGTGRAFVATGNQVKVIRTSDNTVVGTTSVGQEVTAVAVDTALHRAYTTNASSNSSTVIDTSTGNAVATLSLGSRPVRIAVDSVAHRAYASNFNGRSVSVIDTSANQVLGAVGVGRNPFAPAVDPTTHVVYVPNFTDSTVTVIDGNQGAGTVIGTVAQGLYGPGSSAVDTTTHTAFVTNSNRPFGIAKITPVTTRTAQTITFTSTPPAGATIGDTYPVTATGGGSGNPVTFMSGSPTVCTVTASGTVELVGAGTCTVQANQAGNSRYDAAPQVTQTFTVSKKAQTVSLTSTPPSPARVGGTYPVTATGGASGNPVVLSIGAGSDAGACTLDGSTVSFTGAGTCVVAADQAGNDIYAAGHDEQSIVVTKQPQTITFQSAAPQGPAVGTTYTVVAQGGGSGNPIVFTTTGPCTVVSSNAARAKVRFDGVGTCQIAADQAGNETYAAAPTVTQSVTPVGLQQSIRFTTKAPNKATVGSTYLIGAKGGASTSPVVFSVDGQSTAGACTVGASQLSSSGVYQATVRFNGGGSCVIDADQAAQGRYDAAPQVMQVVTISKRTQRIDFAPINTQPRFYFDTTYEVSATGGASGNPVTFFSNTTSVCEIASQTGGSATGRAMVHFIGVGDCEVIAEQEGNQAYDAAPPVSRHFNASAALQAITFTSTPPTLPVVGSTYRVTATGGGSGNPVTLFVDELYSANCTFVDASGNPVATSGTQQVNAPATVKFLQAGRQCVINARQAGTPDGHYNAAPGTRQVIKIGKR